MELLANGITHGQAVTLILLCVFSALFIIFDIFLVLSLRRKNKKLADRISVTDADKSADEETENSTEKDNSEENL